MQAIVLRQLGAADELKLEEWPDPEPASGEVRVRLRAAALNHRDVWIRVGQYPGIQFPAVLGSDGAGEIDQVGENVPTDRIGESVLICPSLDWGGDPRVQSRDYHIVGMPGQGTYAQYLCVPAANAVAKPESLTFDQAAALPLAGLTAWRAVTTRGNVRAGEKVLISGAGGGVAGFALLWALHLGAEVYVTSSSPDKIAHAESLGAKGGVNYRADDWDRQLKELAGGDLDVIVDGAGGPNVERFVKLLGYGGRAVFYGATLGSDTGNINMPRLFFRQLDLMGSTMGTPAEFADMVRFVEEHDIVPQVDRVFDLADAPAAHRRMEKGKQMGKIVLRIP